MNDEIKQDDSMLWHDDSLPAFPLHTPAWHETVNQSGYDGIDFTMGMSMRDYFAAKAMQGWLASYGDDATPSHVLEGQVAKFAYKMADAMLKARNE